MGIDVNLSRKDKTVRAKYYKREYVQNMKLVQNAKVAGIFYVSDKDVFSTSTVFSGNIKKTQTIGVVITHDVVTGLEVDDFVLYFGNLFVVEDIVRNDDTNNKEFSSRPKTITQIRLRQ
jgi:hypothetical protein